MAKKSTEIVPTMLRIREDLRKRLEREAKKRGHSLNAEMAERLENSFAKEAEDLRAYEVFDMLFDRSEPKNEHLRAFASWLKDSGPNPDPGKFAQYSPKYLTLRKRAKKDHDDDNG